MYSIFFVFGINESHWFNICFLSVDTIINSANALRHSLTMENILCKLFHLAKTILSLFPNIPSNIEVQHIDKHKNCETIKTRILLSSDKLWENLITTVLMNIKFIFIAIYILVLLMTSKLVIMTKVPNLQIEINSRITFHT